VTIRSSSNPEASGPTEPDENESAWRAIGNIEARLTLIEKGLSGTVKKPGVVSRLLGKEVSVASVLALVSGVLALFFSVRAYRQSLPEHNIRGLGIQVEPFPMYFWYSRYLFGLSVTGAPDLDPGLNDEKSSRFTALRDRFRDKLFLPYVQVANEGSRPYSITRVKIEGAPDWTFERPPSRPYIFQTLLSEGKYANAAVLAAGEGDDPSSALLRPGDVLYVFPNVIGRIAASASEDHAWIRLSLYSGDERLLSIKQNTIPRPGDPVDVLLSMSLDTASVRPALITAFQSAGFRKLAELMAISTSRVHRGSQ
jgi:hypothetical protein